MKKIALISAIVLAGLSIFSVCSSVKPPATDNKNLTPTTIMLTDSSLSVTLQSTLNGNTWEVPATAASNYLALVASSDFGKTGLSNFQDIQIVFDSIYTMGVLIGTGTDANGARIPIGVEYRFESTSGTTTYMGNSEKHTCSGTPCSCCLFLYTGGGLTACSGCKIIGCYCDRLHGGCYSSDPHSSCNHTVTATK